MATDGISQGYISCRLSAQAPRSAKLVIIECEPVELEGRTFEGKERSASFKDKILGTREVYGDTRPLPELGRVQ